MTVTLITGTSTGFGLVTALHLARTGHQVFATMRDLSRSDALREAAEKERLDIDISQLDVTDALSCERAVAHVLDRAGRIDVLVNNAGAGGLSVIEKASDDYVRECFETNVIGPLRLIRLVLPGMREHRSGTIVNVTSVAGRMTGHAVGIYSATKHALEAASETLALETRQFGIRVAIIEPEYFATPILGKAKDSIAIDETSPYLEIERSVRANYERVMESAADPQIVAEAIEDAITTSEPKLRYLVGPNAQAYFDGRRAITDEQFLEFATP